ncbi:MAG TPA: ABC transporter permease [Terriglobia bacterium]|nr:ABC transporter permease [Terriglobia bacterium]
MRWYQRLFRRERTERQLDAELRFHLEQQMADYIAAGISPEEARRRARLEFGGLDQVKEECRDIGAGRFVETLIQDLRFGLRQLRRNPGFTAVAVVTLALGIGANTAMFSIVDAVLLEPLPFHDPARLVTIWEANEADSSTIGRPASYPDFFDWRAHSQAFSQMASFRTYNFTLSGTGQPIHLYGAIVSANLFSLLGVRPSLGRTFLPQEDEPGELNDAVILSHRLWQTEFGSDSQVLGKTIRLNDHSFTIVGVMPAGFEFPVQAEPAQLWVTMAADAVRTPGNSPLTAQRGSHSLKVIGRLRPHVSVAQAQAALDTVAQRLEKQYPGSNYHRGAVKLVPEFQQIVGNTRTLLLVLFGAVGIVLLIACVNVGNLMLARATTRRREIAVRAALGAARARIVRQLLTESVLLSAIAGGLGGLLAFITTKLFVNLSPGNIPRLNQTTVDSRVLGFTLLVSLVTGVLFGLVPIVGASKPDLNESLKEGDRSLAHATPGDRTRRLLVIGEVALAMILLVGAGLLVQSLVGLLEVNPGFDPSKTLTFSLSLPEASYPSAKQVAFFRSLLSDIDALPGVTSGAAISPLPLSGNSQGANFEIQGQPLTIKERPNANLRVITPDYFRVMRIPLLRGRAFTQEDGATSQPVVIINQTLARKFFGNENPIGRRIEVPLNGIIRNVVGVVGDVKHKTLVAESGTEVYLPYTQWPSSFMTVVVRTENDPRGIINATRKEVTLLDKDLPVFDVKTLDQYVAHSLAQPRFSALLLSSFGILSLFLTAIGLYGMISYAVAQRTHEIGIRMALGAQKRDVLGMVIGQGVKLVLIGVTVGIAGALALTRFLSSLLYGVRPTDPVMFLAVSLVLIGVALLACYIPARRAANVDPMMALRHE